MCKDFSCAGCGMYGHFCEGAVDESPCGECECCNWFIEGECSGNSEHFKKIVESQEGC